MKNPARTIVAALGLATLMLIAVSAVNAGPLRQTQVPSDARWVAHVDIDRLLKTKLGEYVAREFLDKHLAEPTAKLKRDLEVAFDWRKIHSITAFGWDFKGGKDIQGVVVIHSDLDVPATLDQVMVKLEAQLGAAKMPLRKIEETEGTFYQVQEDVFGAGAKGGIFVLARTRENLRTALAAMSGQAKKVGGDQSHPWQGLDKSGESFLLLGVAEGFADQMDLPKQASLLKQAGGGSLMAGERAEKVFLSLALDTKTAETATQIQQLVQGLIALASLNGDQNADLQKLAQGAKVEGREKQVTLALEVPTGDVISRIGQIDGPKKRAARAAKE